MLHNPSQPLSSHSQDHFSLFWTAVFVIILHFALLFLGQYWTPSSPPAKPRNKVIVQTIKLNPLKTETKVSTPPPALIAQAPPPQAAAPLPKENKIEPQPPQPIVEEKVKTEAVKPTEVPKPIEKPAPKSEEIPPVPKKETPAVKSSSPPKPAPVKKETPKKATTAKPAQEVKKTPEKKAAPVKKPAEVKKTVKAETKASTTTSQNNKAKEEAEAKQKKEKEEANRKKQQEADKKREQALAEERKKQEAVAAAQEAARQHEQALIAKAKENFAKIGETRDKIATTASSSTVNLSTTNIPSTVLSLQVDALPIGDSSGGGEWGTKEVSYSDEVAYRLKMALKLPDYGSVKIKLTLDRNGKVVKVETVQSESKKNKTYVESKIPSLLFPSFGVRFQGVDKNTFVITLQNDS